MKEYGIYIRCNGGTPYMIHFYNNIYSAKQKLFEMIQLEEDRGRPYFVDNDFFKNKYPFGFNLKYYSIKVRNVSEFKKYSEVDTIEEEALKKDNKIIHLKNF